MICSFIYSQDLTPMLGKPLLASLNSKKESASMILALNNSYQFSQTVNLDCENNITCENRYSNVTVSFLLKSGFEILSGKFMANNNDNLEYTGIAYHIKKRKYGIGLHFTSYRHDLTTYYSSKIRETGISLHLRFRKNIIKPYMYYSRALMYNDSPALEFFVFGGTAMLNNFIFSMFISTYLDDSFNLNAENAQMNISLGVVLN
jgi:hypothetical protein